MNPPKRCVRPPRPANRPSKFLVLKNQSSPFKLLTPQVPTGKCCEAAGEGGGAARRLPHEVNALTPQGNKNARTPSNNTSHERGKFAKGLRRGCEWAATGL